MVAGGALYQYQKAILHAGNLTKGLISHVTQQFLQLGAQSSIHKGRSSQIFILDAF
jgi:hypothetical protein